MNKKQLSEKGAIIVEVIAVIALLGVLGPMLFKQVLSRNEEVDNINIASEIRSVKEALSAYILTNKQLLTTNVGCVTTGIDITEYLPMGMEDLPDGYNLVVCTIAPDTSGSSPAAPTFIQGFIVPNEYVVPENLGLKRAARIANLIGTDGGIYQNGIVNGTAGGWGIDDFDGLEGLQTALDNSAVAGGRNYTYLATTGMDTYVPEYIVEDYSSGFVTIPDNLAFAKLHASSYFSIGSGGGNCYEKKHNTMNITDEGYTAVDDEIYTVGENNCDPLFWVGAADGSTADKSKSGIVYVKNNLMIGRRNKSDRQAVGIYARSDSLDDSAYRPDSSKENRIEVYDNTGTAKVVINGKGEIISKTTRPLTDSLTSDSVETLTMADGSITSNIKGPNTGSAFAVDPAYTSVMNDIRLESRGGARLSDILPNYITKEIAYLKGRGPTVCIPGCPKGYAPAIVVMPVAWQKTKIKYSDMKDILDAQVDVTEESVSGEGSHKHNVGVSVTINSDKQDLTVSETGLMIQIATSEMGQAIHKEEASDEDQADDSDTTTMPYQGRETCTHGQWFIYSHYPDWEYQRDDVHVIAQTYCVYDKTAFETPEKNRPLM